MKFSATIVTLLAAVSAAEAHNVRVGHAEHHEKRSDTRESLIQKRENFEKRTRSQHNEQREHAEKRPRAQPVLKSRADDVPSLIIGGVISDENEFPYYVDTAGCGGSLIAPKVVLTAAHCGEMYYDGGLDGNLVIVNGYKRGEVGANGILRTVSEVIAHPEYSSTTMENDIELYRLTQPVTGLSVTLSLNSDPNFPSDGTDLTVLGIGMQDQATGLADGTFLYDVVIPVVNIAECDAAWGGFLNPDLMICAGTNGKGACMGDSGGPLVVRNGSTHTQVGVVSFGRDNQCAKDTIYENIFARTSGTFNWIKGVVCDTWNEEADFCGTTTTAGGSTPTATPTTGPSAGSTGSGGYDDSCTDIRGWADSAGDGCDWYEFWENDQNQPVCIYFQFDTFGYNNLSPVDACCVCEYVNY